MRRLFETARRRGRTRGIGLGLVALPGALLGVFSTPVLGGMDKILTAELVRAAYWVFCGIHPKMELTVSVE